jgi:nickel transport protein
MRAAILVLFLWLFLWAAAFPCQAHDFWVEKKGSALQVVYGHGSQRLPYDPSSIKEAKGFDPQGRQIQVGIERKKDHALLVPRGQASVIALVVDDGFWCKTIMGLKKMSKREAGKRVIESYQAVDCSKAILTWGEAAGKPLGLQLEIVPLKNVFEVKGGQKLPVKVLLQGEPLPNAEVESIEHTKTARTDQNGVAEVPLSGEGLRVITTRHKIPLQDSPDADALKLTATLTFGEKVGGK